MASKKTVSRTLPGSSRVITPGKPVLRRATAEEIAAKAIEMDPTTPFSAKSRIKQIKNVKKQRASIMKDLFGD